MKITAITESGAHYTLTTDQNGDTILSRNFRDSGKVVESKKSIQVGKPIEVYILKNRLYGGYQDEPYYIRSGKVKQIIIDL